MIKAKLIKCEPYFHSFRIVFFDDRDEVESKYNIAGLEGAGGVYADETQIVVLVYLLSHEEYSLHPLTVLTHECDHGVDLLYKVKKIKKIEGIDEHHSYLLSWLFGEGLKMYLKLQNEMEGNFE